MYFLLYENKRFQVLLQTDSLAFFFFPAAVYRHINRKKFDGHFHDSLLWT